MPGTLSQIESLRCWAEIDLSALRHNATVCREKAGAGSEIMAVVKADAYGHGASEVISALSDQLRWFGVANLKEAKSAAEALSGKDADILILSPCLPTEREAAIAGGFLISVSNAEELESCSSLGMKLGKPARVHLKVDTGMGRMGCLPGEFSGLLGLANALPQISLEGICTHFPSADEDPDFTKTQIQHFREIAGETADLKIHLANSAGLLGYQEACSGNSLCRAGLALYGVSPVAEKGDSLQPVMTLKTRVTLVREIPAGTSISYGRTFISEKPMTVATLGVGYADGYPRHLSKAGTEVLIVGTRCPLLGRVTMDQIVVDVSHLATPPMPGDEVVLIGSQGKETISATELAEKAGTISWEIFTGITTRVERVYI